MKRPTQTKIRLLVLSLYLFTGVAAIAQTTTNTAVLLREGVVINAERTQVYVVAPDTVVQAISVTTGQLDWKAGLKGMPLTIGNGDLIVHVAGMKPNEVTIANLDVRRGEVKSRSTIALPGNAKVKITKLPERSFRLWAKSLNGELNFYWDYTERIVKGSYEPSSDSVAVQSGAFKMEWTTRKLNSINKSLIPDNFNKESILAKRDQRVPNNNAQQFISRDDKIILASEKIADDTVFNSYRWQFFDKTNKKLAEIRDYRSYAPFVVAGNILIYETGPYVRSIAGNIKEVPLQIVAIDLRTGRELWRKAILDTVYRGPSPP